MSKATNLALDVLERFVAAGTPLRLTEIATELSQPKATVYRALSTLEERGYVSQLPDERYQLGIRCLELGASTSEMMDLRAVAHAHMTELCSVTEENIHLALYDRGEVVYVDKIDSPLPVAPKSRIGTRAPAAAVATGRALLAFQSTTEIERVLSEGLVSYTAQSITDPGEMRALLERVRVEGVATNECSWREGVSGIAAPIRDYTGVVVASVGCCMPAERLTDARRAGITDAVLTAAAAISRELGYQIREKATT